MRRIYEQVAAWDALFRKLNIDCCAGKLHVPLVSFAPAAVRRNPQIVVVPQCVSIDRLCERFNDTLARYGIAGGIAPVVTRMPGDTASKTYQLSDMIVHNDRDIGENGSYAQLFRKHFAVNSGGDLINAFDFDTRMTLAEAMWYHIYMIEQYGAKYIEMQGSDWNQCRGTRGGMSKVTNARANLRWDIPDVKVCLDWR